MLNSKITNFLSKIKGGSIILIKSYSLIDVFILVYPAILLIVAFIANADIRKTMTLEIYYMRFDVFSSWVLTPYMCVLATYSIIYMFTVIYGMVMSGLRKSDKTYFDKIIRQKEFKKNVFLVLAKVCVVLLLLDILEPVITTLLETVRFTENKLIMLTYSIVSILAIAHTLSSVSGIYRMTKLDTTVYDKTGRVIKQGAVPPVKFEKSPSETKGSKNMQSIKGKISTMNTGDKIKKSKEINKK